jgi:outer membrane protein assembly factor BamA
MRKLDVIATLCLVIAVGCTTAFAQTSEASFDKLSVPERKLIAIKAEGSKRFNESDIVASAGLQLGTTVIEDDFKKAARHLADTGAFTDVAYNYAYSGEGTKLEFHLTDANDFVPVRFEDFVWFSQSDLLRKIKEHVSLFNGQLPTSGNLPDQVSDVLQALLVEGGIPGHVDLVRLGKDDGPVEGIAYQVSDVLIRIRKVEFSGASAAELTALEAAAKTVEGGAYSRGRLDRLVRNDLLPIFHSRGFLKAQFSVPQPKPVSIPSSQEISEGPQNQSVVDVRFTITPGIQYKLKSLTWSGNHALSTDHLDKLVHPQLDQPTDSVALEQDLKQIQVLYGTRGLITASWKVNAKFDDGTATVAVVIEVTEGPVYHMGDLEFRGLDNSLTAKLREAWKLRPGDVYDASYLEEYLPMAEKLLPRNFDWKAASHVTPNLRDKTVDVDLIYTVSAPRQ